MPYSLWPALAGLSLLSFVAPVAGKRMAPPLVAQRVAAADIVLVGKVTALEPKTIKAERWVGDTIKGEFVVAIVKVEGRLLGIPRVTHLKVGFIPSQGGRRVYYRQNLAKGQEVLLFLKRHPKEPFYQGDSFGVIDKTQPAYAAQVKEARAAAKLLANPMAGLTAMSANDRTLTAVLLVERYRTPRGTNKTERVGVKESQLILEALAASNWGQTPGRDYRLNPQYAFQRLGLQPTDGWTGADFRTLEASAKKWLKANAGKYRIRRFVADAKK